MGYKIVNSYWRDSSNDEFIFPVIALGDLSDAPTSGPEGLCTSYSASYTILGSRTGEMPGTPSENNSIVRTLASSGRQIGTFYPSSDTISGPIYFRVEWLDETNSWRNYLARGDGNVAADTNDRPGWQGDPVYPTFLASARIDGSDYLGLYKYGYNINDEYSAWIFMYNEDPDDPWNQIAQYLLVDENRVNPFKPGGYSGEGGGDSGKQNFGDYSAIVGPDAMPDETQIGAVASDLISVFTPDVTQVKALAKLLWQKDFLDFLDNQFSNIRDLIISFGMVPFAVPAGGTGTYTWFDFATIVPGALVRTVSLTKAASQFVEFNLGNVSLTGGDTTDGYTSDSVLDYSPYSKLGIYLPFIGYQEMDIDECRGKTINLKYRIDILSGSCLALISINGRTMYQFTGNCLVQLPITSQDCSQMIANTVNIGIAAASAGAAGAIASAGDALTSERLASDKITEKMGDYQNAQHAAQVSNANGSLAGATANGFMGMKPNFKKSGSVSGATTMVGVKQPYLCLTTPRQSMPEGYEKVCGFPCNIGGKLGDFTGFTVVEDIRLNGLVATSPEVEEIYKLLKTGIII